MVSKWPGNATKTVTTFGGLTRSALMSRIRGKGNKTTELRMVKLLRKVRLRGWRRNLDLPGKPDFAWPTKSLAVFIDGCFWHGHSCNRNLTPKRNAKIWMEKIEKNRLRDRMVMRQLRRLGWKIVRIWECQLTRNSERCIEKIEKHLL